MFWGLAVFLFSGDSCYYTACLPLFSKDVTINGGYWDCTWNPMHTIRCWRVGGSFWIAAFITNINDANYYYYYYVSVVFQQPFCSVLSRPTFENMMPGETLPL
jgi:hypothetical protein